MDPAEKSFEPRKQEPRRTLRDWLRDRSLGIFFTSMFLLSWFGQLVVEWFEYVGEQQQHGQTAQFFSGDSLVSLRSVDSGELAVRVPAIGYLHHRSRLLRLQRVLGIA